MDDSSANSNRRAVDWISRNSSPIAGEHSASLGRLWLWLSDKFARDAKAAQLAPALLLVLQRQKLNRWALGTLVNGLWLLAMLSALTLIGATVPRIELGTAVVPTFPRHPMALAGQALTVSAASGGRLTLGIGVGWCREEFEAIGAAPFDDRGNVTEIGRAHV